MKYGLFMVLLFMITTASAQKDYMITIDGKSYEIALEENIDVKIKGKTSVLGLRKKDTLILNEGYFQLKYKKDHKVSRVKIDAEIEQIMFMTAGGSGVIIQTYHSLNPNMLQEMMLNEVTKESVSYGYTVERVDYDKTLVSGETVNVLKAVLSYKGDTETYEVMAHGKKRRRYYCNDNEYESRTW